MRCGVVITFDERLEGVDRCIFAVCVQPGSEGTLLKIYTSEGTLLKIYTLHRQEIVVVRGHASPSQIRCSRNPSPYHDPRN
jgi:hypothetical protein